MVENGAAAAPDAGADGIDTGPCVTAVADVGDESGAAAIRDAGGADGDVAGPPHVADTSASTSRRTAIPTRRRLGSRSRGMEGLIRDGLSERMRSGS